MDRYITKKLVSWQKESTHLPLLVRGARQVGKTYIIEEFGKAYFENLVSVNFEYEPELMDCFETLHPDEIISKLSTIKGVAIEPQKTLLFLDEIQDCPNAIRALRYFKEKMPKLHVIAAGSLLELTLKKADFRLPVGRVESMYMHPVSFQEYIAITNPSAFAAIKEATIEKPVAAAIHNYLIKEVRQYMTLGGMPSVIDHYLEHRDLYRIQALQSSILDNYRNDFGKYATEAMIVYIQKCFSKIPYLVGQQIKYKKIDSDVRSRELKEAISLLEDALLCSRIYATSAQGLPLHTNVNEKKFKLNFLDIGLVKRACQLDAALLMADDVTLLNDGALAEQFVGQELLAYAQSFERHKQYFWTRENQGQAEIDYIFVSGSEIIPIEVKSGKTGRLRSLKYFMQQHKSKIGVRVSQLPLLVDQGILSVPFYMLGELPRLLN